MGHEAVKTGKAGLGGTVGPGDGSGFQGLVQRLYGRGGGLGEAAGPLAQLLGAEEQETRSIITLPPPPPAPRQGRLAVPQHDGCSGSLVRLLPYESFQNSL